jgi:hypothetical protein
MLGLGELDFTDKPAALRKAEILKTDGVVSAVSAILFSYDSRTVRKVPFCCNVLSNCSGLGRYVLKKYRKTGKKRTDRVPDQATQASIQRLISLRFRGR